ncbi:MAG: acetyl-CoA hydrolase/transferase C-terminal domain-containing protein [Dehalococcoidia bacterium]|nr:acetyl-CoA hydrolase/transferase C-terminal domain-containing protein [Dehalococcoidia bacterium]MDD5494944.1 acetyl-CoA hydrolase/transferase C-terminal domain-containing protein [Dehalococcoidia bacterium]
MNIYAAEYKQKLTTPAKAVAHIKNGHTLVHGATIAEPPALLAAVAHRVREGNLKSIKVYSSLPMEHAAGTVLSPDLSDCIEAYSWFVTPANRARVRVGLSYFVPNYIHQIPRLISDYMDIDVVVTTVSPMDKAGYFTFGAVNDYTSVAARNCKELIVEVNENMPRVFGDSLLHISEVTAVVENHVPLLEMPTPEAKPEDEIIAKYIADMVPDGATIELGLGGIPNAIAHLLRDHKDLGIHTGVFVPAMVDLIERGVITGRRKTLHPGKHVFMVAQGTRRMYDFINDNPSMESRSASYAEDPAVIALNDDMVSINTIIEVDLTGQCNAEHMAGYQFSGTGGQLDFVRGAYNSRGGKSIQAFYSTARNGKVSRIVPRFEPGTMVTIPRMDTHYLATEYGVINLKGRSTRERALGIISLAHPKFRDDLLREAENMYLL